MDPCCLCSIKIKKRQASIVDAHIKEILNETLKIQVEGRICWKCLTICRAFHAFQVAAHQQAGEKRLPTQIKHESGEYIEIEVHTPDHCLICYNENYLESVEDLTAIRTFFPSDGTELPDDVKSCETCLETVESFYMFYKDVEKRLRLLPQHEFVAIKMEVEDPTSYFCDLCQALMSTKSELEAHFLQSHSNFECQICHKTFSSKFHLKEHINVIHNGVKPACRYCKKIFDSYRKRAQHIHDEHTSDEFKCKDCGLRFKKPYNYMEHTEKKLCLQASYIPLKGRMEPKFSAENKFICEICDVKLSTNDSLIRHKEMIHSVLVKRYVCDKCERPFKRRDKMAFHKGTCTGVQSKFKEPKTDEFLCEKCDEAFAVKELTLKHQIQCEKIRTKKEKEVESPKSEDPPKTTKDSRLICEVCHSYFANPSSLRRHLARIHNKRATKAGCETCGKMFRSPFQLQDHINVVHRKVGSTCQYCEKIFPTKKRRNQHIHDEHTGDEFKCPDCGQRFRRQMKYHKHVSMKLCGKTTHRPLEFQGVSHEVFEDLSVKEENILGI